VTRQNHRVSLILYVSARLRELTRLLPNALLQVRGLLLEEYWGGRMVMR
jgi:hypothetical protein